MSNQLKMRGIQKCCVCGGLLFTGFAYPDGKPYHRDCYETVQVVVEKRIQEEWFKNFSEEFPGAFTGKKAIVVPPPAEPPKWKVVVHPNYDDQLIHMESHHNARG